MTVTHPTAVRNVLCNYVVDLIDAGSMAGTLQFQTSGNVEVATLTFSDPAFGDAVDGVATANSITSDSSATGGTVTKARAFDSDGNEAFCCSVTEIGGGGDIEINSVVIVASKEVALLNLTYSSPS